MIYRIQDLKLVGDFTVMGQVLRYKLQGAIVIIEIIIVIM